MGGQGSGRPPGVNALLEQSKPQVVFKSEGNDFILPNVSAVQDVAKKGSGTDLAAIGHARQHAITAAADHTSTATAGQILKADASGLPVNATNTDAQVSDAVTKAHSNASDHTQNTDTGTTGNTFTIDSDSATGKMILDVALGAADKSLTITNTALTDNRIATFQNASGTVAYTSDLHTRQHAINSASDHTMGNNKVLWSDHDGSIQELTIENSATKFLAGSADSHLQFVSNPTHTLATGATDVTATAAQLNYLDGATGTTGTDTTNIVFSTSPTLTTPTIGAATATSIAIGANTLDTNEWAALDGIHSAWTSFTPSWTNITVGNGTNTGYYKQIGKTVFLRVYFKLGNTSSVDGTATLTLPVAIAAYTSTTMIGTVLMTDASDSNKPYTGFLNITGGMRCPKCDATYLYGATGLAAATPFTWTTDDIITIAATYEAS